MMKMFLASLMFIVTTTFVTSGVTAQVCSEYLKPDVRSYSEFRSTAFGTLAIKLTSARVGLVSRAGCYDVKSYVKRRKLRFIVNDKDEKIKTHYVAATVLRTYKHKSNISDSLVIADYWRNSNNGRVSGLWANIDKESTKLEREAIADPEISNGYQNAVAVGVSNVPAINNLLSFETMPDQHSRWHAWIVEKYTAENHILLEDTRNQITAVAMDDIPISTDGIGSIRARLYLVKFMSQPNPPPDNEDKITVGVTGPPRCIYLRYSLNGEDEPVFGNGPLANYIVMRIDPKVSC